MKLRIIYLLILTVSLTLKVNGQIRKNIASSLRETVQQKHNQSTKLVIKQVEKTNAKGQVTKVDTAYYREVVRKYGWMEGLGEPISLSIANHLPYYYRMSMKNNKGHWQHVEAMHGDSRTVSHPISTYIIDKDDTSDNSENQTWIDLLKTVTQWVFTTDFEGGIVYEERSYDANNNMVYSYSAIRNQDGRVTGSYNDAWGKPADMREDTLNTYGSVVCITFDRNGCDSIVDYLDGQGLRKLNNNGVDQDRNKYDDKGFLLETMSCNCVGDLTHDKWGNCGYSVIYDHQKGTRTKIYRNKDWMPFRMPGTLASEEQTYVRCDYITDMWGRDSLAIVKTYDGKPDATSAGIHKVVYNYREDGILLSKSLYDIKGVLIKIKEM